MNTKNGSLLLAVAVALVVCPPAIVSAQVTEEEAKSSEPARIKGLCEDIEVMSRLIDSRLSDRFKSDYWAESFFTKGCQGFYVPEAGAIFVLRVKFPVFLPPPTEEEKAEPEEMDLWDREKWRLRLGGEKTPFQLSTGDSFNLNLRDGRIVSRAVSRGTSREGVAELDQYQKKISDLKREIISILGTYGRRISGLADQERIVVAVLGDGGEDAYSQAMSSYVISHRGSKSEDDVLYQAPVIFRRPRGDIGTTLVISARVSDLPLEPPKEVTEDADWVRVVGYGTRFVLFGDVSATEEGARRGRSSRSR